MWETVEAYWPHVLAALSVLMATGAAVHATMTKTEVRAALGWVGVILLSPVVGALIYMAFGINRMRRSPVARRVTQDLSSGALIPSPDQEAAEIEAGFGPRMAALARLGRSVTGMPLRDGNQIEILRSGDETYAAMVEAIATARHSILLESYIFDHDQVGLRIVSALAEAQSRGVAVRVLVDAVGVRYSNPTILRALSDEGLRGALFNGRLIIGLRLPYANLRTHRKILVIDDQIALVGGMNIREGFTEEFAGNTSAHDTHFRVRGPVVTDYRAIVEEDWSFATSERLDLESWDAALHSMRESARSTGAREEMAGLAAEAVDLPPAWGEGRVQVPNVETLSLPRTETLRQNLAAARCPGRLRVIASGPDARLESAHKILMGAFSIAERHIRIMSPYFLPDRELISALTTAARRGVVVDIVTPAANNLTLVDRAMKAQFDQVLKDGCRVWRAEGPFDHSKLLTIDGVWSFVGSSNIDPRSLRLNFEVDTEVFDRAFAALIAARIDQALATARPITLEDLRARPFLERLANRALWLGSPYL